MNASTTESLAHEIHSSTENSEEASAQVIPASLAESSAQLLLRNKFISHHPKAGINPLVDSAAYLFSIMGKLKQMKSYSALNKLQEELVHEINSFEELANTQGYNSEYILVSRYAICVTLDDIISHTTWGQDQWEEFCILNEFKQDKSQQGRFFVILERIIKDPALYIDLMEFMYLCLSLGFKGNLRIDESGNGQFEQICNALYKRIRAYQGDTHKTLSPYPIKPTFITKPRKKKTFSFGFVIVVTASVILALFIGLAYLLDTISNQAYQELMHIGKSILYETHDS